MKFLPYEHICIRSSLSGEDVLRKLHNVIEPKRFFRRPWSPRKDYEGKIEGFTFYISRIVYYRNSFIPRIKGDIQNEVYGCSINITMQMHLFVTLFMVFWLGIVGLMFLLMLGIFLSSVTQTGMDGATTLLFPLGMFTFGYLLCLIGFKFESLKSKKYFQEIFQAYEMEELGIANPIRQAG